MEDSLTRPRKRVFDVPHKSTNKSRTKKRIIMIINLTPHPVKLRKSDGSYLDLPASKTPCRVVFVEQQVEICGIKFVQTNIETGSGIPPKNDDNIYVVSYLSSQYLADVGYNNIVCVNTKDQSKDGVVPSLRRPHKSITKETV